MPAKKKTAPVKLTANPRGSARVSKKPPLTPAQLKQIDAYWRASNYLTACQLYLLDNRGPETDHRGPLGYLPGPELHLYAFGPGHQAG